MKSHYIDRAKKFVRQFVDFIGEEKIQKIRSSVALYGFVRNYNEKFNRKVEIKSGISRSVLLESDYVIKIDFYTDKTLQQFGSNETECALYKRAVEDGYAYLFAPAVMYEYKGVGFEIMPRLGGIGDKEHNYWELENFLTYDEYDYVKDICNDIHGSNFSWTKTQGVKIIDYASNYMLDDFYPDNGYGSRWNTSTSPTYGRLISWEAPA